MADRLSEKHRLFVEAYMGEAKGNATEAARVAGYANPRQTGSRLLTNANILGAIDKRAEDAPGVMTRQERQQWWTQVARGEITTKRTTMDADGEPREYEEHAKMADRIKATELLGKSQADFVDRHEHSGAGGGPVQFIVETSGDGD